MTLRRTVLGALVLSSAACSFERRPDRSPDADPVNGAREAAAVDSLGAVVRAFHEAVERGDLARAAAYLHADAVVYDQSLSPTGTPALTALDRRAALRPNDSTRELQSMDPTLLGESATVVTHVRESTGGAAGTRTILETLVLVRGSGGWVVRHIHRSTD